MCMLMDMDTCAVEGCSNPRRSRGWCTKHYQRWQKYGDPNMVTIKKPADGEPLAYFKAHVDDEVDGCNEWPYGVTSKGYGAVYLGQRQAFVHILACERHHGPRPEGMEATHAPGICHNRRCFNYQHLAWDTPSANNSTHKEIDGTASLGEKNPGARLTADQVEQIRERWAQGGRLSKRQLAAEYGVSEMTIGRALRGELWKRDDYSPPQPRRMDGLTDEALREIKTRYAAGARQKDLAAEYGVGQSQISRIVRGWVGGKPPTQP